VTGNVVYRASYSSEVNQYTLSGEIDRGTAESKTVDYGSDVTIMFQPAEGYTVSTYQVNDGQVLPASSSGEWGYHVAKLMQDTHVKVTTVPIVYTISYELNGGELGEGISNPAEYTVETDTFTLNNPTRAGYKFLGWTASANDTGYMQTVTIQKGTTGNKAFYANWERSLVDLTITTTSAAQEQSFIFTVIGTPSDSSFGEIILEVVLVGTDSITIKDLPVGIYTVTEKSGWSWRENTVESKTANLTTASLTVDFDFGIVDDVHWLSSYSYNCRKGGS